MRECETWCALGLDHEGECVGWCYVHFDCILHEGHEGDCEITFGGSVMSIGAGKDCLAKPNHSGPCVRRRQPLQVVPDFSRPYNKGPLGVLRGIFPYPRAGE